jgi:hypothetical protein
LRQDNAKRPVNQGTTTPFDTIGFKKDPFTGESSSFTVVGSKGKNYKGYDPTINEYFGFYYNIEDACSSVEIYRWDENENYGDDAIYGGNINTGSGDRKGVFVIYENNLYRLNTNLMYGPAGIVINTDPTPYVAPNNLGLIYGANNTLTIPLPNGPGKYLLEFTVNGDDDTNGYGIYFHTKRDDDDTPSSRVRVDIEIDFVRILQRMRKLRSQIAPIDGHDRGITMGTHVYQGYRVFTSPTTIEVVEHDKLLGDPTNPILTFNKAVIATGGKPRIPTEEEIPGLCIAPYTTNVNLFNLQALPPRLVILGAGVVAMEMAQAFATFGSNVTVVASGSSGRLLSSSSNDDDVISALRTTLENDGVTFLTNVKVTNLAVHVLHTALSPEILILSHNTLHNF